MALLRYTIRIGTLGIIIFSASTIVFAQQPTVTLEERVKALEDYAETIQPSMVELSEKLNWSIQKYTDELEKSLEDYSRNLQSNLDQRLAGFDQKKIAMNPYSKSTQRIETNIGTFLFVVESVETIDEGVRLHFNIGNPNYADYQDFSFKFIWGMKRSGDFNMSYDQWRQSLKGVTVAYKGKLEKGKWNSMTVDLIPADKATFNYLECNMNVDSVELGINKNQ